MTHATPSPDEIAAIKLNEQPTVIQFNNGPSDFPPDETSWHNPWFWAHCGEAACWFALAVVLLAVAYIFVQGARAVRHETNRADNVYVTPNFGDENA